MPNYEYPVCNMLVRADLANYYGYEQLRILKTGSVLASFHEFSDILQDLSGLPGWTSPQPGILESLRLPEAETKGPPPEDQVRL